MNTSINFSTYSNNLDFYTGLKLLLQCKLTDSQLILLQNTIGISNSLDCKKLKTLLCHDSTIVKSGTEKFEAFNYFINCLPDDKEILCSFVDVFVDLLIIKDLILLESKHYAIREYSNEVKDIYDLLSVEYDIANLHMPYGQRVVGSLLLFALTDYQRDNSYFLSETNKHVKIIGGKCLNLARNYNINVNSMFQIIMDESMNQSIKSDAGAIYEARAYRMLLPLVENLSKHSHDSNIKAVEYDFKFEYNGKKCGVSAKRTLRERYKQNHEDVAVLDVDYMFVVTLGIDLNENKVNHILEKEGNYIIVSGEQFEAKDFLKQNKKVISSRCLKDRLKDIII